MSTRSWEVQASGIRPGPCRFLDCSRTRVPNRMVLIEQPLRDWRLPSPPTCSEHSHSPDPAPETADNCVSKPQGRPRPSGPRPASRNCWRCRTIHVQIEDRQRGLRLIRAQQLITQPIQAGFGNVPRPRVFAVRLPVHGDRGFRVARLQHLVGSHLVRRHAGPHRGPAALKRPMSSAMLMRIEATSPSSGISKTSSPLRSRQMKVSEAARKRR